MAATTEAWKRAEHDLTAANLMLGDLPEVAAEWAHLPAVERASWSMDWGNQMAALSRLTTTDAAGLLTAEQQTHLHGLLKRLALALPVIVRLGLRHPPTPNRP